jgi:hypothetical protein
MRLVNPVLPSELAGHFFGVGSLGEKDPLSPVSYIKRLALPYTYQTPSLREEDMIRQFGALVEGFEEQGDFVFDIDIHTYREVTEREKPIMIDEAHLHSIFALLDGTHYNHFKTQQTAPATMAFSIRGSDGKQHLTEMLFHFYCRLMERIAEGQVAMLADHCHTLILCQDDPGLGHVRTTIEEGKAPDLNLREIIARTDKLYPDGVIPAYHYCDDWRGLEQEGWHALWDAGPKLVHLDLVRYHPEVSGEQAEQINSFLKRGGGLALGVMPNVDESYSKPLLDTLAENLHHSLESMQASGVDLDLLRSNTMVSTQCGLSGASVELTREIHSRSHEFPAVFDGVLSRIVR